MFLHIFKRISLFFALPVLVYISFHCLQAILYNDAMHLSLHEATTQTCRKMQLVCESPHCMLCRHSEAENSNCCFESVSVRRVQYGNQVGNLQRREDQS